MENLRIEVEAPGAHATASLPEVPFDPDRYMGTVSEVRPDAICVDLPMAGSAPRASDRQEDGELGEVGQFVCIEVRNEMAFGRIVEVALQPAEQQFVDPDLTDRSQLGAVGVVDLMTSVSLDSGKDLRGINVPPALGNKVYAAHPKLISWIACGTAASGDTTGQATLALGHLAVAPDEPVQLNAEQLFGRHCAVLGTTGSGKSWTIARLIEQASQYKSNIILLDATGEFHTLRSCIRHVHVGTGEAQPEQSTEVSFPHAELVEDDLFALFTPSGEVQVPRMRSAIRSLKLAAILGDDHGLVDNGCIPKAGRGKAPFNTEYSTHAAAVQQRSANFNLELLPRQIELECVWPSAYSAIQGQRDHTVWGEEDTNHISMCDALVSRIQGFLQAEEFACLFGSEDMAQVTDVIDEFMSSDEHAVLRISMKHLSYTLNVREIVVNAIGRLLLGRARAGAFREQPVVIVLDEAHQFLNKTLGEKHAQYPLDAFDLIAKEGRKDSLTICLSTQRPGDIPAGVLSQVGTQIVHRLVNRHDREAVEQGITHLDQSAARFLPAFAPGEAVIVGVYMSVPLSVRVLAPQAKPDSSGADYDGYWSGEATINGSGDLPAELSDRLADEQAIRPS